jgi:5-methylthioribose kinase
MKRSETFPAVFPRCLYADAEKMVIVMENLKSKGYQMLKMEGAHIPPNF